MDQFDCITVMDSTAGNACGGAEAANTDFNLARKAAAVSATKLRASSGRSYVTRLRWNHGEEARTRVPFRAGMHEPGKEI